MEMCGKNGDLKGVEVVYDSFFFNKFTHGWFLCFSTARSKNDQKWFIDVHCSISFMSVKVAMGSELIKADWSGENRDLRLTDHDFRWANCRFGQQILAVFEPQRPLTQPNIEKHRNEQMH